MDIGLIGIGNIGIVTALCFAHRGHQVHCYDIDHNKVALLQSGQVSVFEPNLQSMLESQLAEKNITFDRYLENTISKCEVLFITVGTPNNSHGQTNMQSLESAMADIDKLSNSSNKTIVIKSTILPGTTIELSQKYKRHKFIASPEFLREGSALDDCLRPNKILIGSTCGSDARSNLNLFKILYKNFDIKDDMFLETDSTTAELTKYASNVFLASRISLINEFSQLSEKVGADIEILQRALGLDPRIGPKYLNPGIGYGGSCLPKDTEAIIKFGESVKEDLLMTKAIVQTNKNQIHFFTQKIIHTFKNNPANISIWGAAFKPETDDLREAPSVKLIYELIKHRYNINIYDPVCKKKLEQVFNGNSFIKVHENALDALKNNDALVICTEWDEFRFFDLDIIKKYLRTPIVFDGRRIFKNSVMNELGFDYYSIGTKCEHFIQST